VIAGEEAMKPFEGKVALVTGAESRGRSRDDLPHKDRGLTMAAWSADELREIAEADDLHVAPFREDGVTCGTPTWIWSVAVDGDLYVRAYNGKDSSWYQAALRRKAGRITAAGRTRDVTFEPAEGPINERIDDAYGAKYRGSPYLAPMIGARARSASVRVTPRDGAPAARA
jgi:hypothetical protein